MMKKIGIGVAVLVVLVAGISFYLYSNMDSYVKAAIEKNGSAATKTAVRVDSVKISLSTGEGTVTGITVDNPSGYAKGKAISIGSVLVKLDIGSVRGTGPILIRRITVERPQVAYEFNGSTGNLQVLQKNAAAYAAQFKSDDARKEIIDDLAVKGGEITATAAQLQGKSIKLPMPPIHLTNIGKSTNGATPGQIAGQVVAAITHEAEKVAAAAVQKEIMARVSDAAGSQVPGGVGNQLKGLLGK
jgi:hypothetical protein